MQESHFCSFLVLVVFETTKILKMNINHQQEEGGIREGRKEEREKERRKRYLNLARVGG